MSIKKDEGLTFEDTNKGLEVLKEKPLDYYSDVFSPGQTKQRLKIGREVEGNVGGGQFKTGILANINTNGSIVVNTIGFNPKLIKFTAIYSNGASSAISIGHYCNGVNNSVVSYENATDYSSNSRCFRLGGTNGLGNVTATDNNGFTLNVSNSGGISYTVLYECFG